MLSLPILPLTLIQSTRETEGETETHTHTHRERERERETYTHDQQAGLVRHDRTNETNTAGAGIDGPCSGHHCTEWI